MLTKNKVAIVTGSGRRLGRQIAISLAKKGYNLIINYNHSQLEAQDTVKIIRKYGVKAILIEADISKKLEVQRMINRTIKEFGRIDLLVNNASIFLESSLNSTTEKKWDATIDINLKGTFLCSQAVAPYMLKQKKGRIINIASLGGLQPWKEHLPYSISKAGVIMLTKILAKTLAPDIHVNAIAPGTIFLVSEEKPGVKHIPVDSIPLKKYGNSKDVTDMVIFLSTTSRYITGQVIPIDGGRSI